jgi:hypothetical protein
VVDIEEIELNGTKYPLPEGELVQTDVVPPYLTSGTQRVKKVRFESAQGGIGRKDFKRPEDAFRLWYGTSHLRVEGHRTLPDKVTTTAASGVSGLFTVGFMEELANAVYVSFSTALHKYDFNGNSWGSSLHTLAALPTDSDSSRYGGTVYMTVAYGTGFVYTTNGSSFTTSTTDAQFLASWDDRFWAIDSTGQLRWAFDPTGTFTNDAQLPLPDDYVQDLFVSHDASGEHILYASTKVGLFAHDANNNRFVKTNFDLPFHDDSGAAKRWRDASYINAGLAVYEYKVGGDQATIRTMGPDKDSGLPFDRRGKIVELQSTHNDLIAIVDSTSAAAEAIDTFASAGMATHASPAMSSATGISLVLGWNGLGWQVLHETAAATEAITTSLVSNAYGGYRFWFGHNRRVKYFTLPVDVVNPSEITDRDYADASLDEYPDFDGGRDDVDKIAVRLTIKVAGTSSTETVIPSFALNGSTSFTTLSTLTSDGIHVYHFPGTTAGSAVRTSVGTAFRSFRPRTALANGTDDSKSPDILSTELEYREKLTAQARHAWTITLDLDFTGGYKGNTANQLREAIVTAQNQNLLMEFTYRSDDGNTRNFPVEVASVSHREQTGDDERGTTQLVLVQV